MLELFDRRRKLLNIQPKIVYKFPINTNHLANLDGVQHTLNLGQ